MRLTARERWVLWPLAPVQTDGPGDCGEIGDCVYFDGIFIVAVFRPPAGKLAFVFNGLPVQFPHN
jgi:hypothetical protein